MAEPFTPTRITKERRRLVDPEADPLAWEMLDEIERLQRQVFELQAASTAEVELRRAVERELDQQRSLIDLFHKVAEYFEREFEREGRSSVEPTPGRQPEGQRK